MKKFFILLGGSLAITVSSAVYAIQSHLKLVDLGLEIAEMAAENKLLKKSVAQSQVKEKKAVAKTKAKARVRRAISAIPVLGTAAFAAFEYNDYQQWLEENPGGTKEQYGCEVLNNTSEVFSDVANELPENIRPSQEAVFAVMPTCNEVT
jgi:hypothetical protein